jgi:AraC-like DNA-binding protein
MASAVTGSSHSAGVSIAGGLVFVRIAAGAAGVHHASDMDPHDPHGPNPDPDLDLRPPAGAAVSLAAFGSIVIASGARCWVPHIHREHQMNFHLSGGDALVRNEAQTYRLRQGEYNLHNPWATHSVQVDPGQPCGLLTINISPDWLAARCGLPPDALPRFSRLHATMSPATRIHVEAVVRTMAHERDLAAAEPAIHALIDHIFALHRGDPAGPVQRLDGSNTATRIRASLHYIESNAVSRIRIADLAAHASMSRSHFFREFQSRVGTSPLRVIDAVRVSWAVERLLKTNTPIAVLGDELGFSTPSHFGRFFAAHIGLSPSEYRGLLGAAQRAQA